jgi:hypothetical protein
MPTLSWIVETVIDRDAEARHVLRAPVPIVVRFPCKACGRSFSSSAELANHVSRAHPLELPSLYLRGQPLLRESVIRTPLQESDVHLVQCTSCRVRADAGRWREYSVTDFRRKLVQYESGTWDVDLIHERTTDGSRADAQYHIRFRIADPAKLDAVDQLFADTLLREGLTHSDLHQFQKGLPSDAAAREYGAALGNYVLGILLKERQVPIRSQLGLEEFAAKMRTALDVLQLFQRPLALAVCSSIRFNLNEFASDLTGAAVEVETGFTFFRSLGLEESSESEGPNVARGHKQTSHTAICPVDQISHRILAVCGRLLAGEQSCSDLEDLLAATNEGAISEQDLVKIRVICAEGYLRLGYEADALPHFRAVQYAPVFREWARRHLTSS